MTNKILTFLIGLFLFSTSFSYGQDDIIINGFQSQCLKVLEEYNSDYIQVDSLEFQKKHLQIVFEADVNCVEDNLGKLYINEDTLKITDNDIRVEISKKDLVGPSGDVIEIELKTEIKEEAFCICRTKFKYDLDNLSKKVKVLDFNGRIIKLK